MSTQKSLITLELDARERQLILDHGYPFDGLKRRLELRRESDDVEEVPCNPFELEQLLGDLAYTINRCKNNALQDELNELFEDLEYASTE